MYEPQMPFILARRRFIERRSQPRDTVTDTAAAICLACAPLTGFCAVTFLESNDPLLHLVVGVVMVMVSAMLVPLIRWMMRRMDGQTKQDTKFQEAREAREEKRAEAFQQQVVALGAIVTELRLLNDHHKDMDRNRDEAVETLLKRIDDIPGKVAKKLNGE